MRNLILSLIVMCFGGSLSLAQAPDYNKTLQLAEMKKLAWMTGKWKGPATVQLGPNNRREVTQTENVQLKIDGTVLLVEGLGTSPEGKTVFNALAMISYDAQGKAWRLRAYTREGNMVDADVRVIDDNNLEWGFASGPAGRVRYTVKHTDKDQWHEVGEFSPDGKTWTKFQEMTLSRQP